MADVKSTDLGYKAMDTLADDVRQRIRSAYFNDKVLLLPNEGGEWVDTIRDALWEAFLAGRQSALDNNGFAVGLRGGNRNKIAVKDLPEGGSNA